MKWLSLKIYLLPLVMQEVDTVTEKYINLINELRRTNDENAANEFDELRNSITKRIHELETFYEDNIHDLRITNFEKARLRLKKLLMYDLETLSKIENTAEFFSSKTQNLSYTKNEKNQADSTPAKKEKENNSKVNSSAKRNIKQNVASNSKKPSPDKSRIMKNQSLNTSGLLKNNLSRDQFTGYSHVDLFNPTNMAGGDSLKEINKWKEIVFKIKLTDKEYELLLKEKSKGLKI